MSQHDRLRSLMRQLADELGICEFVPAAPVLVGSPGADRSDVVLAAAARRYLRLRRERDALLGARLFADPAWDLLLDLFAAGVEGGHVSVSSACIAAAVPPTTALRWLKLLEDRGLIERMPDPLDRRRCFLGITHLTKERVGSWLGSFLDSGGIGSGRIESEHCERLACPS